MEYNINDLINSRGVPEPLRGAVRNLVKQLAAAQEELEIANEGLTAAYLSGFHKRDDEVRAIKEELAKLRESLSLTDRLVSGWWSNLPDAFCAEYNAIDAARNIDRG